MGAGYRIAMPPATAIAALLVGIAADVRAAPSTIVAPAGGVTHWGSDPLNTVVLFSINHSNLLDVHGVIPGRAIDLTADIDDKDLARTSLRASFRADALTTNGPGIWEKIMTGPGGLDVARYPTIEFRSRRISSTGAGLSVTGTLTLHGVTREITLALDPPSEIHLWKGNRYRAFQATTVINRQDFGMNWREPERFAYPVFADEIRITMILELASPPLTVAQKRAQVDVPKGN